MKHLRVYIGVLIPPVILLVLAWMWSRKEASQEAGFDHWITEASARYSISPSLIRAVIWKESRFDPLARGDAGERGLMQVTELAGMEWAEFEQQPHYHPDSLTDPRTNILAGSWYLARSISRWQQTDRPEVFGLAEYNAGRSHARRWASTLQPPRAEPFLQIIDFPSTRQYIDDVLERAKLYAGHPHPPWWILLRDRLLWLWEHHDRLWSGPAPASGP